MSRRSAPLLKAALSALYYSGADELAAPYCAGRGVIFMLHHVRPDAASEFGPNRTLSVTPQYLESVVQTVIERGFDLVSLDEVRGRLAAPEGGRPFACFTFDDGYRDNRDYAYPILKRHGAPFTVYVTSDFADGRGNLWWTVLENVIGQTSSVSIPLDGTITFQTQTVRQKDAAFRAIYRWFRAAPEAYARTVIRDLAGANGIDVEEICARLCLSWEELRAFAEDPLVTIGAHTLSHAALAKLPEAEARREMIESVARIEKNLGRPCRHLAYPYGSECSAGPREFALAEEIGLQTAVTTRKGLLYASDADTPTALPRLSLNGDFQDIRYLKVMLSGVPFAAWNTLGRLSRPLQQVATQGAD